MITPGWFATTETPAVCLVFSHSPEFGSDNGAFLGDDHNDDDHNYDDDDKSFDVVRDDDDEDDDDNDDDDDDDGDGDCVLQGGKPRVQRT